MSLHIIIGDPAPTSGLIRPFQQLDTATIGPHLVKLVPQCLEPLLVPDFAERGEQTVIKPPCAGDTPDLGVPHDIDHRLDVRLGLATRGI
jgi:hypothetical protein